MKFKMSIEGIWFLVAVFVKLWIGLDFFHLDPAEIGRAKKSFWNQISRLVPVCCLVVLADSGCIHLVVAFFAQAGSRPNWWWALLWQTPKWSHCRCRLVAMYTPTFGGTLCFYKFCSNFWLIFAKLWEASSRLYRRQILQVDTKYSFESPWRDLQDGHIFAPFRIEKFS